jgi:hypothetical protein
MGTLRLLGTITSLQSDEACHQITQSSRVMGQDELTKRIRNVADGSSAGIGNASLSDFNAAVGL